MDPLTIIAIIIGLLFAGFLFFVEEAFEKMLNPLFRLVGLNSSCGPLEIRAEKKDESIILVIKNLGKSHASLASIQGRNANGKTIYPIPYSTLDESIQDLGEKRPAICARNSSKKSSLPNAQKRFT